MSAFDPETGVRIGSFEPAPVVARAPRNPYAVALVAVWALSGLAALALLMAGLSNQAPFPVLDPEGAGFGLLIAAFLLGAVAVVAGVAHLAVRAATWRPPER